MKPGYKTTDVGIIPDDWGSEPVANLVDPAAPICYGVVQVGPHTRDGVPIVAIKYVKEIASAPLHRTAEKLEKPYARSRLKGGDVLVSIKGTIGRVGVVPTGFEGNISRELARLRISKENCPEYIAHQLEASATQDRIMRSVVGTTRLEFSIAALREFDLPIPNTKIEQTAIASALNDIDALLNSLERLIAKKRDLKKAAMQQLLTGQTRLPGFTGQWDEKRLGECLLSRPGYGINAPAVPFSDKLPAYIRITDISEFGRFCPNPRVSVNFVGSDQYNLRKGDIVFARTGASVGKSYLYSQIDGDLVFAGFLIRVRPNHEVLIASFLAAYATTQSYWNWVRLMSMRSGQPGINGNEYSRLPLRLPLVTEQTAIAEVLSDMDAEIAALEKRVAKTRDLKQGMMQELLTGKTRLT